MFFKFISFYTASRSIKYIIHQGKDIFLKNLNIIKIHNTVKKLPYLSFVTAKVSCLIFFSEDDFKMKTETQH